MSTRVIHRLGPLRALLVEDNPGDAELVRTLLSEAAPLKFEVDAVGRVSEAIEWLAGRRADVILLDLHLPDASGPEAVERMKKAAPHVPIIVLSGSGELTTAMEALQHGAENYLVKGLVSGPLLGRFLKGAVDRVRTLEELRLTQVSVDRAGDAVFWVGPGATIVYVNDQACRSLGYSREELTRMAVPQIDPDYPADRCEDLFRLIRDRRTVTFESRHRAKDGRLFPVEITSHLIESDAGEWACVSARDITERRQGAEKLALSMAQRELVTKAMSAMLEKGDWREASALLLRGILELTSSEYGFLGVVVEGPALRILAHEGIVWSANVNRDFYEAAMKTYREVGYLEFTNFKNLFGTVITSGKPVIANEATVDPRRGGTPPGHPPLRHFLGIPVLKAGSVIGLIGVANRPGGYREAHLAELSTFINTAAVLYDNYRRQLREADLQRQILQVQKLESIGLLAGGVAHDFNNLLMVILGYCELAQGKLEKGSPLLPDLQEVRKAGERAAALTRQLLTFSRRQVLEPKVIDLNAVITEMHKMLRRLIGENIELVTLPAADLGCVRADPGHVEQVILNMAVNARDAMPEGGKLTIRTSNVTLDAATAERSAVPPGPYVAMTIADTGSGMDEKTLSRIFEPFFTTKESGKGTGLGLATCYGIARQSGGAITVKSQPGAGTTFTVFLPRVSGAPSTRLDEKSPLQRKPDAETILFVEDEPAVRNMQVRAFQKLGYTVLEASNGEEALQRIDEFGARIDLVITDAVMPRMGGGGLVRRLRERAHTAKILMTSGYTGDEALPIEGVAFIQKPYTPAALAKKVREVLDATDRGTP